MEAVREKLLYAIRRFWCGLREWSGDAAYERYVGCAVRDRNEPLTAAEFYVQQLNRKYSRPSRCC